MGNFFDSLLGAYVDVETAKAQNNFDAYQQGMDQAAAIREAELQSQQTQANDVTDLQYQDGSLINGVDNRVLYVGGALLAGLILYKVVR
ncbi:hypothetical protein GZ77_03535 [Endozoicomonas montiporae]|uniref:Uncharacterized protein n=2 Tax=Endozoicomonas montiporae TaxID=1027273 RepID=A0A081NB42_9GAMM|nr:hypothetical protein [Endozoicomonas montiporae]AMO56625.1 hypothetical protein EZMO1_2546 [Endozoicomonas montiporae CL-33]KEQ15665.1 hypothetical protein GZ77_03535 [Endozoicomonas montiporae]